MTAEALWSAFLAQNKMEDRECEAWAFGVDADHLADLVLRGVKTATSSAYPLYAIDHEPLPAVGEYSVILDSRENAVCVIQTTRVYSVPFRQVSADHAHKEGEGDCSVTYWRQVHAEVFCRWMAEAGLEFTWDMQVVCEEFRVVYKP